MALATAFRADKKDQHYLRALALALSRCRSARRRGNHQPAKPAGGGRLERVVCPPHIATITTALIDTWSKDVHFSQPVF
jgi:hypothetical protein